jgi:hypothetical protein
MNKKSLSFALLWILTLAAAYTVGSKRNSSEIAPETSISGPSQRSDRGAQGATTQSSQGKSRGLSESTRLATQLSPLEAVTALANLTDPLERSRGFLKMIDRLGPDEFLAVVDEFRGLGITTERMAEYQLLLTAWAKVDPITALDYAKENTGGGFARDTILATWARNDLEGSLAWAKSNHEGEGANPWMVGIINGIADIDPIRASQLTEDLPYSHERGEALRAVVGALMKTDPNQAREWAEAVGDEKLRSGAIAYVADALSRKEPEEAAQWLASVDNVEAQQRAAENVAERLANYDMDKAKAWAESLSPEVLDNAAEGVVDRLVEKDPIQAAEWLAQIGQSDVNLDGAIGELIRGSARQDPYLAATWINGLSSQRDRERNYHRILGPWMETDKAAAQEFLQNTDVPDSIRKRFGNN